MKCDKCRRKIRVRADIGHVVKDGELQEVLCRSCRPRHSRKKRQLYKI